MRWGVEVWDRFEDVSNYVYRGIEFCERYEEFWKKRSTIENTYAKNLRKLIESFEPKKKEAPNHTNNFNIDDKEYSTHVRCFFKMLSELRDVAGQHELIAENVNEKILSKLTHIIKNLKEDRKKCIEEKDKYHMEHILNDEQLEKCKQKYEKAFKEVEKAEDLLVKVENDDAASKNDIKKQKAICDTKKRTFDLLEAEYGRQLCEANRIKNSFYYENLPSVFDTLQNLERRRIENFKEIVCECASIEIEVLPRIRQCYKEIETSAQMIDSSQDIDMVVKLFKTGYQIPNDHVFENLSDKSFSKNNDLNGSLNSNCSTNANAFSNINKNATMAGHTASNNSNVYNSNNKTLGHMANSNMSRQKKYRTLNRLKGLFIASATASNLNGKNSENEASLYDLPPQQLKNELIKKMKMIELDIEKQNKEREGLLKLKDIYSKNQKFGDSQSAEQALKSNEEKLVTLKEQLQKYQDIFSQVEITINNNNLINQQQQQKAQQQQQQSHYTSSGGDNSSSSGTSSGSGSTLGRDVNKANTLSSNNNKSHIYPSPSKQSLTNGTNQSLPTTPNSNHSRNSAQLNSNNSNLVAYAVSPLSQLNVINGLNANKAPLVNNNESFDDDDDGEEDVNDNNYETPMSNLKSNNQKLTNIEICQSHKIIVSNNSKLTSTEAKIHSASLDQSSLTTNTINTSLVNSTTIIDPSQQYDQVDANVYEQTLNDQLNQYNQYDDSNDLIIGTALVMYSFAGTVQNAMSIEENESLNVLERDSGDGWTLVKRLNGEKGYVPTDYIRIVYY